MHRIDNATAVAALPAPAALGTPGFFTGGNKPTGLAATRVDDDWCNSVQEEIANVVLAAGMQLSKVSNTQLYEAIQAIAYGANPDLSAYLPLSGGSLANPGNLNVGGQLYAAGNVIFDSGLTVVGPVTAQQHIDVATDLIVRGAAYFNQTVAIVGDLRAGTSFFGNEIHVGGNGIAYFGQQLVIGLYWNPPILQAFINGIHQGDIAFTTAVEELADRLASVEGKIAAAAEELADRVEALEAAARPLPA